MVVLVINFALNWTFNKYCIILCYTIGSTTRDEIYAKNEYYSKYKNWHKFERNNIYYDYLDFALLNIYSFSVSMLKSFFVVVVSLAKTKSTNPIFLSALWCVLNISIVMVHLFLIFSQFSLSQINKNKTCIYSV